jgi:hypothetical protein
MELCIATDEASFCFLLSEAAQRFKTGAHNLALEVYIPMRPTTIPYTAAPSTLNFSVIFADPAEEKGGSLLESESERHQERKNCVNVRLEHLCRTIKRDALFSSGLLVSSARSVMYWRCPCAVSTCVRSNLMKIVEY